MLKAIGSGLETHMHREARERALNTVMEAQEEAERLLREAEEAAQAERLAAVARTTEDLAARRRQALAQARLAARRAAVAQRQALLDSLWARAAQRLQALAEEPDDARRKVLANLLEDAAAQLAGPSWTMQVAVAAQDLPLLSAAYLASLGERLAIYGVAGVELAHDAAPILGGVIARKTGSRQMVDNSFDERLALTRRMLRDEIERRLTPDTPARPGA